MITTRLRDTAFKRVLKNMPLQSQVKIQGQKMRHPSKNYKPSSRETIIRAHLNAVLRGWQNYFSYGAVARTYATVNRYVYDRVRRFLRRRHTTTHSRGTRQFPDEIVFGRLGVYALRPQ